VRRCSHGSSRDPEKRMCRASAYERSARQAAPRPILRIKSIHPSVPRQVANPKVPPALALLCCPSGSACESPLPRSRSLLRGQKKSESDVRCTGHCCLHSIARHPQVHERLWLITIIHHTQQCSEHSGVVLLIIHQLTTVNILTFFDSLLVRHSDLRCMQPCRC